MTEPKQIAARLKDALGALYKVKTRQAPGLLGDGTTEERVIVTGATQRVWFRPDPYPNALWQPIHLRSDVPLFHGMAAIAEFNELDGEWYIQQIDRKKYAEQEDFELRYLPAHADQHIINEDSIPSDPVWVYRRAMAMLRGSPPADSSLRVYIQSGDLPFSNNVYWPGGYTGDLTGSLPAAGNQVWLTLSITSAGAIDTNTGSEFAEGLMALNPPPDPDVGNVSICHVLLSDGTTSITETEIWDARRTVGATFVDAQANAFKVENTSGAAATANDVGYIDEAGEYKTTTTAYLDANWCAVVTGGANNTDIYVSRRGKVTITLTANCSVGDFLYLSGTATQAIPQSYMRPEAFAVALTANASGAGGTCEALLLCHTKWTPGVASDFIFRMVSTATLDFIALIDDNAGAHGGQGLDATHVPYDTISSGAENTINITSSFGVLRLYNSTRATYRLITSVDTVNDVIVTVSSADAWADNDSITIRSQLTDGGAGLRYVEVDLSQTDDVPVLARAVTFDAAKKDTGAEGLFLITQPYKVQNTGEWQQGNNFNVANFSYRMVNVALLQRRFCISFNASGAATASQFGALIGYHLAAP